MQHTTKVMAYAANPAFSTKNNYLGDLRKYLQHKNKLSEVSSFYFNMGKGHSLAQLNNIFSPLFKDSAMVPLKKVCELVLINACNLRNVLPAPKNASFKSSCDRLDYLLTFAKHYAI